MGMVRRAPAASAAAAAARRPWKMLLDRFRFMPVPKLCTEATMVHEFFNVNKFSKTTIY
jgi:hypothetical protein